ncbi:hypothetical protein [Kordiimonas pumila]|uniref:DUF2607 family protein n=1 Tax=Kordiimonas pumila TaxID=2161677 RepID=A0ABV7D2K2_9PROT|nr:hypothetical protein [Kordiimonas pumila]
MQRKNIASRWRLYKSKNTLFVAVFLLAQLIGAFHTAAYGESRHSHGGQPCIISATCSQIQQLDITPAITLPPIEADNFLYEISTSLPPHVVVALTTPIRAPPALSHPTP